jgi:Zn-dependent protease with chaperone function
MVEQLDAKELEAVLAHEIGHIAHHDYLIIFLATMLRDAFFYLPPIHLVYRQLQEEKELRGDEGAITLTQRPLALASALTKVWLHTVDGSTTARFRTGQHLVSDQTVIRQRIERLLHAPAQEISCPHPRGKYPFLFSSLSVCIFLLISLLQFCVFCVFMMSLGCFPFALIAQLFS